MAKILVNSSGPLHGEVHISGAKNSVLPLLAATILTDQTCVLEGVPDLVDVNVMKKMLVNYGSEIDDSVDGELRVQMKEVASCEGDASMVQEMRASRMAGKSLDVRKAESARYAMDRTVNTIAFAGDEDHGLMGILSAGNNIPLYTLSTVTVNSTTYTDFAHKMANQILDDINGMFAYQSRITKNVERADTLALPPSVFIDISTRQIPNTGYTVKKFLLENAPYLKNIVSAPELEADSAETNPYAAQNKGVALLYTKSAEKFSLEIPMAFYQYPLQNRNLEVVVPCEERVAGIIIYYPLSMLLAVGI